MTIQDIKLKYRIENLTFYRLLNSKNEKTKWLKATNEDKSIAFIIHEFYLEQLKLNPLRKDICLDSTRRYDTNGDFIFDRHIISLAGSVMTISLFNKEHIVGIIPNLKNIRFNKIQDFEAEYNKLEEDFLGFSNPQVRDKIAIEFDVTFNIDDLSWTIPYVVILEKIYCKTDSKSDYVYRKGRARLRKFEEIEVLNDAIYPYLLHTLLLLDRSNIDYIKSIDFESFINEKYFFFYEDLKYNSNKNCLYVVSSTFYKTLRENQTNINLKIEEQFSFKESKYKIGEVIEGYYYFNIFPIGFFDSYIDKFTDAKGKIIDLYKYSPLDKSMEGRRQRFNTEHDMSQGDKMFQGSYKECFSFLNDKQNLSKIKTYIKEGNKKTQAIKMSNESFDYYNGSGAESDYFDAITDGQIGTYDDFIESGGNIDNLENYI